MFFLISDEKEVLARCKVKTDVTPMIMNFLNAKLKVPAIQTISWDIVLKDGYFYHKNGDDYELREYKISKGYLYNGLYYNVLGRYHVCEFNGTQESKFKPSFVQAVNSIVVVDKPAEPPCPLTPRMPLIDEE